MKLIILALFLLGAVTCCIEEQKPEGLQIINYQRNNFLPPFYQFIKPPPEFMGMPSTPPLSGECPKGECPNHYRQRKNEYVLSFDWAPRTKGVSTKNFDTSQGLVKMESEILARLSVQNGNTAVKHEEINLNLENGDHTLIFEGTGKSDIFGISIANVVLRRKDSSKNLLINGDFSYPNVGFNRWRYIRGGIQGWSADIAEIGDCRFYNNDWKSGQCIELDSNKNQFYSQKFRIAGSC